MNGTSCFQTYSLIILIVCLPLLLRTQSELVINQPAKKENYEKAMSLNKATPEQLDSITFLSINFSYSNKDSQLPVENFIFKHADLPIIDWVDYNGNKKALFYL